MEWLSNDCRKPVLKYFLRTVTTGANSAMSESQFIEINCDLLKAREKSRSQSVLTFHFAFASRWLKNWRDILKTTTKRSDRNSVISFDGHLKAEVE